MRGWPLAGDYKAVENTWMRILDITKLELTGLMHDKGTSSGAKLANICRVNNDVFKKIIRKAINSQLNHSF